MMGLCTWGFADYPTSTDIQGKVSILASKDTKKRRLTST